MTREYPVPTQRLFTALPLDETARYFVADIITRLSGTIEGVRWVPAENLHVTLRFIGECQESKVPALEEWMVKASRHLPESIEIGGVGSFPSLRSARVIWVGANDVSDAIQKVYNVLDKGADRCGFGREERKYRPHVTVGRSRKRPVSLAPELVEEFENSHILLEGPDIVLYRSDLKSDGAVYTEIARVGREGRQQTLKG